MFLEFIYDSMIDWMIFPLKWFFCIEGYVALDRNPGPGYNTLHLRFIPRDLYSSCPNSQFQTLRDLLHSQVELSNSYRYACGPSMEVVCTIFTMFFGMTRPESEPTNYHVRCGDTSHWAIPTRYLSASVRTYFLYILSIFPLLSEKPEWRSCCELDSYATDTGLRLSGKISYF